VRKIMMLTLGLVISAVWSHAQSGNSPSDAGQNSGKPSSLTTLEGCVQLANNQYTLTDSDRMVHQLAGAANKLGRQVGHWVELSGKPGIRTVDTTNAGAGSSAVEQSVFEVKSVKLIAATCQ